MHKILILILLFTTNLNLFSQDLNVEIFIQTDLDKNLVIPSEGRLFLIFNKEKPQDLFNGIQYPDLKMNPIFGVDIKNWNGQSKLVLKDELYGFPINEIAKTPTGKWYVSTLYDVENLSPYVNEADNYYSKPIVIEIRATNKLQQFTFSLNKRITAINEPTDRKHFKYLTFQSKMLSEFWKQPMELNCQVILPKTYYTNTIKNYPLLVIIGGFGSRHYDSIIKEKELFTKNMPQMIVVLLDSKSPYGDSYQINSANNGPYGNALIYEFIPFIEKEFRCIGKSNSRFLAGTSTGGWSSLALQIFYPDFFNGVWSTCADPVDFRQMELIDIYEDDNAFINRHEIERPAMRDINGEPRYTLRTEVWAENVLGNGNSYVSSGGQWGSWNAVFSPKDSLTNLPMALFDPHTGTINKDIAKAWEKFDLRLYLSRNWEIIGSKLQGKLHIWMGTADSYYLNNAMVLFDRFLKTTKNPTSDAEINFICGEGHACDSEIPIELMMQQMVDRMKQTENE